MSIEAMKQAFEAIKLALSSRDVMILTDPPQDAWKSRKVSDKLFKALDKLEDAIAEAEKQLVLPHPGSRQACEAITNKLREYEWPANPQNAARAGWEAARKYLNATRQQPKAEAAIPTTEQEPKREWVGLTHAEYLEAVKVGDLEDCWQAIEAKLREKNPCGAATRDKPDSGVQNAVDTPQTGATGRLLNPMSADTEIT
jgi:hypothetical protein